ncbi:hypothetical protein HanPSC8_Chr02g0070781 [Helianthus annuus]|nr:hypothetical protein HanPSC8_Chr02g0070781 [Helianthus annuus]
MALEGSIYLNFYKLLNYHDVVKFFILCLLGMNLNQDHGAHLISNGLKDTYKLSHAKWWSLRLLIYLHHVSRLRTHQFPHVILNSKYIKFCNIINDFWICKLRYLFLSYFLE